MNFQELVKTVKDIQDKEEKLKEQLKKLAATKKPLVPKIIEKVETGTQQRGPYRVKVVETSRNMVQWQPWVKSTLTAEQFEIGKAEWTKVSSSKKLEFFNQ